MRARPEQAAAVRQTAPHSKSVAVKHFAPPIIRVADEHDAPFVSALVGTDAAEYMQRVTTLVTPNGFFFLEPVTSSILEAHMAFYPEGRGKEALRGAHEGLLYAFTELNALVVFGRIPVEDRAARLFTRMIGFTSCGVRPGHPNGPLVEWFELRADEYFKGDVSFHPQPQ